MHSTLLSVLSLSLTRSHTHTRTASPVLSPLFSVCCRYSSPLGLLCFSSEVGGSAEGAATRSDSPAPSLQSPPPEETERPPDPELEKRLLGYLSDLSLSLPTDSLAITDDLNSVSPCFCVQVQRFVFCLYDFSLRRVLALWVFNYKFTS